MVLFTPVHLSVVRYQFIVSYLFPYKDVKYKASDHLIKCEAMLLNKPTSSIAIKYLNLAALAQMMCQ